MCARSDGEGGLVEAGYVDSLEQVRPAGREVQAAQEIHER
jgi:hypothetical protein